MRPNFLYIFIPTFLHIPTQLQTPAIIPSIRWIDVVFLLSYVTPEIDIGNLPLKF
jgi:hypothetical protein